MNLEPPNTKQPWGDGPKVAGIDKIAQDCVFVPLTPRLRDTNSHPVDAYAFRIGGVLITYFPETNQFSWYKHLEKIRTNPAWIPLKGPVPKSLQRRNNTYLVQVFPRSAEWFDGLLAQFGKKNLPDVVATALLLEIEEELGRKEGLSNGN
jgi:hypothetical protein